MKKHILGDYGIDRVVSLIKQAEEELDRLYGKADHNSREFKAIARRIAYFEILNKHKRYYSLSLSLIGECVAKALGRSTPWDHASVAHNSRTAQDLLKTSRDFGYIYKIINDAVRHDMIKGNKTQKSNLQIAKTMTTEEVKNAIQFFSDKKNVVWEVSKYYGCASIVEKYGLNDFFKLFEDVSTRSQIKTARNRIIKYYEIYDKCFNKPKLISARSEQAIKENLTIGIDKSTYDVIKDYAEETNQQLEDVIEKALDKFIFENLEEETA